MHNQCMPERSSIGRKRPRDLNQRAVSIMEDATGQTRLEDSKGKNPAAVELGRLGGKRGGKARAEKLSPERRKEIARLAARARWGNH
jgi:hypothetical protein